MAFFTWIFDYYYFFFLFFYNSPKEYKARMMKNNTLLKMSYLNEVLSFDMYAVLKGTIKLCIVMQVEIAMTIR